MKIIDGGVTAAKGFQAASTAAEIDLKAAQIWLWCSVKFHAWLRISQTNVVSCPCKMGSRTLYTIIREQSSDLQQWNCQCMYR